MQDLLNIPDLWPLRAAAWSNDTFYGLIEVFHDLVARPRERWWHPWNSCGWHYSVFAISPAQALYRWKVNKLLASGGFDLRLADSGEDVGRLVHVTNDDRQIMVDRALRSPDRNTGDHVQHVSRLGVLVVLGHGGADRSTPRSRCAIQSRASK